MSIFNLIPLSLLLMACGHGPLRPVNGIAQPYVDEFVQDAKDHNTVVNFDSFQGFYFDSDLQDNVMAVCHVSITNRTWISISPFWWNAIDDGAKRALIYHELGHCILGRDHEEEPGHIMSAELSTVARHWDIGWDLAIDRLFTSRQLVISGHNHE